ncbi:Hypothetical predicted protein [Paramuricea clavata]|uniref:Uncharacterized protein n=1 Tax=Paramuricea clavata TaxID=317549 RepID=A0A7D9KX38_PARCT|nr:Hypothetical predicted protein [Paramuricea clavata]
MGPRMSGPLRVQDIEGAELAQVNFVAQTMNNENSLESNVQKLWSFEGLGIREKDKVHEEFLDGISFTGRMENQLRRLKKEAALLTEYDSIIREQVERGIVEPVAALEKVDKVHYLPHQAVIRKDAVTRKVRVVYDASSKECKSGTSLNDCLHIGPSLNPLLYSILIRFRENRIALVGGAIEKAFLNVEVDKADRDCLRFLWVKDIESDETVVYRFCRVVFGLNA